MCYFIKLHEKGGWKTVCYQLKFRKIDLVANKSLKVAFLLLSSFIWGKYAAVKITTQPFRIVWLTQDNRIMNKTIKLNVMSLSHLCSEYVLIYRGWWYLECSQTIKDTILWIYKNWTNKRENGEQNLGMLGHCSYPFYYMYGVVYIS